MKIEVQKLLEAKFQQFNQIDFIKEDPISIPHMFSKKENIEIMGFWVAILSWGQRKTILRKAKELIDLMDGNPHDFILHFRDKDLKRFENFKHRTFQYPDTLYFLNFFQRHYKLHQSLESAFSKTFNSSEETIESSINRFYDYFFDDEWVLNRTKKHISRPASHSACKRICMFLRWMVRQDANGVDFGLWKTIKPSQLICPLDVHVQRQAEQLGLIPNAPASWKLAVHLTKELKKFDINDPVKYDFALFGLGIESKKML
ncbi:MAG: hypothetical protein RJA76_179 [Bacteroidota bacterium]|jgi:uncharacterized protein (TIGR02757 family)